MNAVNGPVGGKPTRARGGHEVLSLGGAIGANHAFANIVCNEFAN